MSERDPAAARFAIINLVRLAGVGFVVLGILVANGRILPDAPDWVAYLLVANGLVDAFVIPAVLVRKWRTPK
ncbi:MULTISPECIES: hypothetical protein [Novosphingobium]|jgi:hypothetical protein|uniref:Uncharacterized protein n=1 Tax=Novosphingobium panipatense TaxID=428991 RepID=A0ABY1PZB5_9SPHN|nr:MULTISPECIES: hypothetical protein [Novosphingobium]SMP52440.1 hypothetical protein SAMN06296065_101290 [Novosphingobium panipatense]